jgi:hypothetical protein
MMEKLFRPIAILTELALLMGTVYALFAGVKFTLRDLGLNKKYDPFMKWVFIITGCLALVFFAAHLMAFYPRVHR